MRLARHAALRFAGLSDNGCLSQNSANSAGLRACLAPIIHNYRLTTTTSEAHQIVDPNVNTPRDAERR